MNSIYAYDTKQTSYIITNRIYSLLELNGWSLKMLSDESDIPYETLKKLLNRKIESTSIHNIIKIASAFHCQVDYLVSSNTLDYTSFHSSAHTQTAIRYFTDVDSSCQFHSQTPSEHFIPLYRPFSFVCPPSPKEPALELLDIAGYPEDLRSTVECGILISSHHYHPIYQYNDILLISRDRFPHNDEIAIFIHHGNLYIRQFYTYGDNVVLEPVNGIGHPILLHSLSSWLFFGYVSAIHR